MTYLSIVRKHYPIIFFLIIFFILAFASLDHFGLTYDELRHFQYGENILDLKSDRMGDDDSKMPVTALNAIPRNLSQILPFGKFKVRLRRVSTARMATILFAGFTMVFVFLWAKKLYGLFAASFSAFLFAFEPNLLAHARLITTDLYAAGTTIIYLYYFWWFLKKPCLRRLIPAALAFGIAQVSKYSCVFLVHISLIILTIRAVLDWRKQQALQSVKSFCRWTATFGAIVILVINVSYWFNGTATLLKNYTFESQAMRTIQGQLSWLGHLPVPLPFPYVMGLDRVKFRNESGYQINPVYFFGQLREVKKDFTGFKLYYFATLLFKVPLAILIIFSFSLFYYFRNRAKYHFLDDEIFLLVPIIFYLIQMDFFLRIQIGVRHALVFFPLALVFCGSFLKDRQWEKLSLKVQGLLATLGLYLVFSSLSYFPHYLSYFNELVWDRKMAYKIIADSNLDWGGNKWYYKRYHLKNPDLIYEPEEPQPGKIVVQVNALLGIFGTSSDRYRWLRENFTPVDHIAYSYLVYEVSEEKLAELDW